jgi:oxygen-independent coproporphyrinogen III oxidase
VKPLCTPEDLSGIYLHIPFCRQACSYCDFFFTTRSSLKPAFLKSLIAEIGHYRGSEWTAEPVRTVYFGGGTPSRLTGGEFKEIFDALSSVFSLAQTVETTAEVNPDDLSPDYLKQLKEAGINRLSVGIQTFNPERLKFMNRAHTREQAIRCLEMIGNEGYSTWTADLIYGNPGQDTADLAGDIERLLCFDPPHISAYSLTVEPNTRLGSLVRKKVVEPAGDDLVADHTDVLVGMLGLKGIERYEVSNFARPGHEAIHNSAYWTHENYLGLGPGAHSFRWKDNGGSAYRWCNRPHLPEYLEKSPNRADVEELFPVQLAEERLMMGLRTREGVSEDELRHRYGYTFTGARQEVLQQLRDNQLIQDTEGFIQLTAAGLQIADRITLEIISR